MKLRRFAIVCLTLVMFASGLGAIQSAPVFASTITMVTEDLNTEELSLGVTYNFPASIKAEYNSQIKTFTNGVVVYPSGKTSKTGKQLSINEAGLYTIRYFYLDDGKRITAEKKFTIKSKLYELTKNDGSTIEKVENNPINTVEGYRNFTVSDGLKLNLKDGNTFVYNKVIDLRETVDDSGKSKIAWFDPAHFTTTLNEAKAKDDTGASCYNLSDHQCDFIYFRITDAYDPSIYVDISVRANNGNFKAGGSNQVIASWDAHTDFSKPYTNINATRLAFTRPDQPSDIVNYIVRLTHNEASRTSRLADFKSSHNYYDGFKLYYDLENNAVYYRGVNVGQNGLKGENKKDTGLDIINELNAPEVYGNGKNGGYFPGFTTGEVKLSIFGANYYSSSARVDLIGVGNDEGKDLIANHGEFSYVDTVAPDMKVNVELTDETGVYAAIGETYTIPSAIATDVNLVGEAKVTDISVYRGYGSNTVYNVPIENGAFKVKYADIYTIVYRAYDSFGNVTEKTLNVTAKEVDSGNSLLLTVDKLTDTLEGGQLKAGLQTQLPEYTLETINREDKKWVKQKVLYNGEEVAIDENGCFMPLNHGTYTIRYEYGDNANSKIEEYDIQCVASSEVVFLQKPVEYRYFIPGVEYTLEPYYAYTFASSTPKRVLVQTFVKVDGAEAVKVENIGRYKVPSTATTSIQFVYKYVVKENGNDVVKAEKEGKVIPVKVIAGKGEAGYLTEFFAGDFAISNKTESKVRFDSNATSGNSTLYYINPISLYDLSINYVIPSGYDRYEAVKFTFTDYGNEDNKITVRIVRDGNDSLAYFQDQPYVKATEPFMSPVTKTISYSGKTKQFKIGKGITYDIDFNFESKMCYVEVELQGIKCQPGEKAGIIVTAIGNQNINGRLNRDNVAPIAAIDETRGTYQLGDIITINVPTLIDVITPVVSGDVFIKVTDENGTVLKDIDTGVLLNMPTDGAKSYRIKLESLGMYTVSYGIRSNVPSDKYGVKYNGGKFNFTVVDTVKPVIEFTDGYNEYSLIKVKYGDSFTVNYTVSDNLTAPADIKVFMNALRHENQVTYYFIEGTTFKPTEKGTYTLTISATDKDNNVARRTLKIIVE